MASRWLVGVGLALGLLGCDMKTQKQVFDAAKPTAEPLRAKLVAAANLVDKKPPTPPTSTCKAPKPLVFDPSSDAHNTDYMMLQEAKRGAGKETDAIKDEPSLNLSFGTNPFPRVMRGTSPTSMYADYMLKDTANADFQNMVKRGLKVTNVVLVKERLGSLDYFLVDLAPPTPVVVCTGTITPTADPNLEGAHTQEYLIITKNRRTGKEVKRETKSVTTDAAHSALYTDAVAQLTVRMHKELGLDGIE